MSTQENKAQFLSTQAAQKTWSTREAAWGSGGWSLLPGSGSGPLTTEYLREYCGLEVLITQAMKKKA